MYFKVFPVILVVFALGDGIPIQQSSGNLQPHIIGGVDAPEAYAPHMVALIHGVQVKSIMCGGSIISRSLVLTAAHCIDPFILADGSLLQSFRLNVGSNQWNSGGTEVQIKTYHNHPHWDVENIKYDAGVLFLEEKLNLCDTIRIIELNFDWVGGHVWSYVTGWGGTGPKYEDNVVNLQPTPDDLQLMYLLTITPEQCERAVRLASADWPVPPPKLQHHIEICAYHSIGHGMCSGDSGSALVRASTGQQIGIVSWGLQCASGAPDMFTRIRGIKDFVLPIMERYRD